MSYRIRVLLPQESVPARPEVARTLQDEGLPAEVLATPTDANWLALAVEVPGQPPVQVSRALRTGEENPVDEELDVFLDLLLEEEETPGLAQVEAALCHVRQIITLDVPDSYPWGGERNVVDALVELLSEPAGALIQADGEGFYDRDGNLLVPLE